MSVPDDLKEIQRKLRRNMTPRDTEGLEYEQIFGCDPQHAFYSPHVGVRVEMRSCGHEDRFAFRVYVDFHLPVSASPEEATEFARAVARADKKSRWAENLVSGKTWSWPELIERRDAKNVPAE